MTMIQVENLSKSYGPAKALDGISFEVERGEVVGFLGPNGAGKSTTMKILTGYLLPTSGSAKIDGLDVVEESLEVRRRIGYLPESTPLYTEMRVDEYLRFAAEIRGVKALGVRAAVDRVVDLCGLERVFGKNILELSKGYKQRVGLAQAMIHEPDLLILDEPTSGLDPNQIVEVRSLITRLSETHTVILSTHYLQEVEASCSRVVIVNLGELVADGTRDELVAKMPAGPIRATIKGPQDKVLAQLAELVPTEAARVVPTYPAGATTGLSELVTVELQSKPEGSITLAEGIAHLVVKNGWGLQSLTRHTATLEEVFRSLTGKAADKPSDESAAPTSGENVGQQVGASNSEGNHDA